MKTLASNSINIVLVMAITGLLSGSALVSVYLFTKNNIEENRQRALEKAVKEILPGTFTIQKLQYKNSGLEKIEMTRKDVDAHNLLYAGLGQAGGIKGYAIPAKGPGFMDDIALIYGYHSSSRTIIGMAVLESRETPGLGDKIIFDEEFLKNFERLRVDPEITGVKHGTKTKENEVDCISGATISSKAVANILQASMEVWKERLKDTLNAKTP